MDSVPENFEVLRELKVLLKYLNIYNKFEWFSRKWKLFKPLTYFVLSIPVMIYFLVPLCVCILYEFDLKVIASPLMVTLGTLQELLMFYSFALNSSLIMQALDALQQLVQRSVIFSTQIIFNLIFNLNQFPFELRIAGCNESPELTAKYFEKEKTHMKLAKTFFLCSISILVSHFGVISLIPIFYAIFGFPAPETWTMPIPMMYTI